MPGIATCGFSARLHFEIRQYSLRADGFLVGLLITGNPAGIPLSAVCGQKRRQGLSGVPGIGSWATWWRRAYADATHVHRAGDDDRRHRIGADKVDGRVTVRGQEDRSRKDRKDADHYRRRRAGVTASGSTIGNSQRATSADVGYLTCHRLIRIDQALSTEAAADQSGELLKSIPISRAGSRCPRQSAPLPSTGPGPFELERSRLDKRSNNSAAPTPSPTDEERQTRTDLPAQGGVVRSLLLAL